MRSIQVKLTQQNNCYAFFRMKCFHVGKTKYFEDEKNSDNDNSTIIKRDVPTTEISYERFVFISC